MKWLRKLSGKHLKNRAEENHVSAMQLMAENMILRSLVDHVAPSFEIHARTIDNSTPELFDYVLASSTVKNEDWKKVAKSAQASEELHKSRAMDLEEQIEFFEEELDARDEALTTLRAQIRNKVIEEEIKQQVNVYKERINTMTQTMEFNNSITEELQVAYGELLVKIHELGMASSNLDLTMYKDAMSNVKDLGLEIAKQSKAQIIVPELTVSKE